MDEVVYRDIEQRDLPALKSLMAEAFGREWNFERLDPKSDFYAGMLEVYLNVFLSSATYGKVAVMDGRVVGAILVALNGEVKRFRLMKEDGVSSTLALLTGTDIERMTMAEVLTVPFESIALLLENKVGNYDGSLDFFAVTQPARGLKIGKRLWSDAAAYCNDRNAKSISVITNSGCNVGFYDFNGFSKVDATETLCNYPTGQRKFDTLLYDYRF